MTSTTKICHFSWWAVFALALIHNRCLAQSPLPSIWPHDTASQLKGIYERGDFRPKAFQAEWLSNSSGYSIQEGDPKTGTTIKVAFDVRTGERMDGEGQENSAPERQALISPDGQRILEFREGNIVSRNRASGQITSLTRNSPDREEHFRNPQWSPDGSRIVFVESDSTNVRERAVLVPSDPTFPGIENHRFARVGEAIESLRVGMVDANGENLYWLPIESPAEGFYLGQVEWAGNSQEILVEQFSRFRNQREFFLFEAARPPKRILLETNEAWVESSQGRNSGLTWIQGGKAFVVVSEKDGWRHAFLWSREGNELAVLTPGDFDIIERATIDEDGGWFYFYASPENGTERYLYRVPLDGSGQFERITPVNQPGTHHYEFSPDSKWAFHTYSTLDSPPLVELVELTGHRVVRVLEDNQLLRVRMQKDFPSPTEFLQLDIGNGITMDASLTKPQDFDPEKKYPVFVYVYGEPHAQTVLNEWGAGQIDFHRVVANLGYLVVSIDNRGTPAPKGAAWRRAVFGSLGPLSTEEQAAGLLELARTRSYVDLSRVGIWGWSGGGSNTLNAMFRKPDLYHVGIAVVPKPQPQLYNAWFQEIFMQTPQVNSKGYEQAAAINFAEGLKGKLLIITGSGETNTHIQIIEGLVDRLIELGKPFDYMVYPNRDHGLREGQGTTVHVRMLIARFLLENLPPGPR